jgi:hypothetical protein
MHPAMMPSKRSYSDMQRANGRYAAMAANNAIMQVKLPYRGRAASPGLRMCFTQPQANGMPAVDCQLPAMPNDQANGEDVDPRANAVGYEQYHHMPDLSYHLSAPLNQANNENVGPRATVVTGSFRPFTPASGYRSCPALPTTDSAYYSQREQHYGSQRASLPLISSYGHGPGPVLIGYPQQPIGPNYPQQQYFTAPPQIGPDHPQRQHFNDAQQSLTNHNQLRSGLYSAQPANSGPVQVQQQLPAHANLESFSGEGLDERLHTRMPLETVAKGKQLQPVESVPNQRRVPLQELSASQYPGFAQYPNAPDKHALPDEWIADDAGSSDPFDDYNNAADFETRMRRDFPAMYPVHVKGEAAPVNAFEQKLLNEKFLRPKKFEGGVRVDPYKWFDPKDGVHKMRFYNTLPDPTAIGVPVATVRGLERYLQFWVLPTSYFGGVTKGVMKQ